LETWLSQNKRGIAQVVTGGGKTIFAGLCAQEFLKSSNASNIFILVPTVALADQWRDSLIQEFNYESSTIAVFGGGKRPPMFLRFNVMVANTARRLLPTVSDQRKSNAFLIVDECHRFGSVQNAKSLEGAWAATLGLSATPEREHDEYFEEVIAPKLGPIFYTYEYMEAGKDEVIVPFDLVNIQVPMTSDEQSEYDALSKKVGFLFGKLQSGLDVQAAFQSALIARARVSNNASLRVPVAVRVLDQHRRERSIVFHESISEAEHICRMLGKRGHRVATYHSKHSQDVRDQNLTLFKRGTIDTLITCRALDEGVNIPEARVAVIASSTSSLRQRIQRLGRVLRPFPGKTSATIYTLFCTESERERLLQEEKRIGARKILWLSAEGV
jgi:superfamily II DNA or RNA helicase